MHASAGEQGARPAHGFVAKLAGAFALVVLLLGGTSILSIWQLAASVGKREGGVRHYLEDVVLAERLRAAEDGEAAAGRGYLIARTPNFLEQLELASIAFDRALANLHARASTEDGRQLLDHQSLKEAGVQAGDVLRLQPEITAGSVR